MTETPTTDTPDASTPPLPGLLARAIGVITTPGATLAQVARTPKVAGMLFLVAVLIGVAQGLPQFTERGRAAALEMQVQQMETFGMEVTDEVYQQMAQRSQSNLTGYIAIVSVIIVLPIGAVIITALLWVVFNTVLGGTASFKHVMAIVVHSQVISVLGALFAAPIMYARGVMSSGVANLGALLPMLDETSFLAKLLGMIDLFAIWWVMVLAIGLAALYKKKAGSIATGLFVFYGLIALVIAFFTAG
jgi:hypothetical protein